MASITTPATSSELLERIDRAWRPFRDAVRGLGRARMDERTPAGWTYRDLIAHVAAWEDLTARRMRIYRETGVQPRPGEEGGSGLEPFGDVDAFNARVVEAHRLVGPEALVDELDTSHRRLVGEIARLSDEQVRHDVLETPFGPQSWVVAVVAGNSFGHYAEHAGELGIAVE